MLNYKIDVITYFSYLYVGEMVRNGSTNEPASVDGNFSMPSK